MAELIGVAEAKRRFSELIERVHRGDRFLVARRGKPAIALVPPNELREEREHKPIGLAAIAGGLADWGELEEVVAEIYKARRTAKDRPAPDFE
ncbi:MAG: type II toxin-antitoxin system prevent-host-death family antitoxin [Chloroflexi bacterium]|nr:type II toxin-antitoxin system prevent-host-death family antitoxin [Chloroflexota bacterium]